MSKQNVFKNIEERTIRIARQCNSIELLMIIAFTVKMLNKLIDLLLVKLREESKVMRGDKKP